MMAFTPKTEYTSCLPVRFTGADAHHVAWPDLGKLDQHSGGCHALNLIVRVVSDGQTDDLAWGAPAHQAGAPALARDADNREQELQWAHFGTPHDCHLNHACKFHSGGKV